MFHTHWRSMTYSEVGHVGDEDVGFDDLGNGRASFLQDRLEVRAALVGLLADRTLDKNALGGEGDLTREVDGRGGLDGLRLFEREILDFPYWKAVRAMTYVGTES